MFTNLHVVLNNFRFDGRVLKETKSIADNYFDKIYIAALWEDGVDEKEILDAKREIWRVRLRSRKLPKDMFFQTLKYIEWIVKIYFRYKEEKVLVVHCHDLAALPVGVLFKLCKRTRVIYDAHELETEQEIGYREKPSLRKRISCLIERLLIPAADAMITVSPSIQRWYAEHFPQVPIDLVRNIPANSQSLGGTYPLRSQLKIPDNALLFLYLGILASGRGIQIALNAFRDLHVSHHLAFMGSGPLHEEIIDAIKDCPRFHLLNPVPPHEVVHYSSGADVGICLYEDTCLSLRYSLPNKLFESLLGGVPVLASDLPDQAAIVRAYNAGWVVQNNTESIANFLIGLTAEEVKRMRSGLTERVKDLSWDSEAQVLLCLYKKVLAQNAKIENGIAG